LARRILRGQLSANRRLAFGLGLSRAARKANDSGLSSRAGAALIYIKRARPAVEYDGESGAAVRYVRPSPRLASRKVVDGVVYIITEPCIGTKDKSCVDVCPVDCIHGADDDPQLYIDPEVCVSTPTFRKNGNTIRASIATTTSDGAR
jgi:ferredoxin